MGLLANVLFWPETAYKSIAFHIFRHICIGILTLFASYIHPSIFTVYLALVSLIEYSRRCQNVSLLCLYFTFTFSTWLSGYLYVPFTTSTSPSVMVVDFLRSIIGFLAIVFDRVTVKRFGLSSAISMLAFPILVVGCFEILGAVDHLGISTHLSVFCGDYPDFSFLFFKIFGPPGVAFAVSLLAAYTSQWKLTRTTSRFMSIFLFGCLPLILVAVGSGRYLDRHEGWFVNIGAILSESPSSVSVGRPDLIVMVRPMTTNQSEFFLNMAKNRNALVAFSFSNTKSNISGYVCVAHPDGTLQQRYIAPPMKRALPFRTGMKDMLVSETSIGRIGFIAGREMFKPEFFASRAVDLLVTFGGSEYDEKCKMARRAARMTSQMIGASRFHGSAYWQTFALEPYGIYQFRDVMNQKETVSYREFPVKVRRNTWKNNGTRFIFFGILSIIHLVFVIIINLLPRKYASAIFVTIEAQHRKIHYYLQELFN